MGFILRLDGRFETEEQTAAAVGVVTQVVHHGCRGRVWPIAPHVKPELRLKAWSKGKPIQPSAYDVYLGDGSLDYQDLPAGIFEAEATPLGVPTLMARVVFRVAEGGELVVLARNAGNAAEGDRVIAELSGWTLPRLAAERSAYSHHLAAEAAAVGFAELIGTERQTTWANELRPVKYAHAAEYLATRQAELATLDPADGATFPVRTAVLWLEQALPILLAINAAVWWVDRHAMPGVDILRQLAKRCRDRQLVAAEVGR